MTDLLLVEKVAEAICKIVGPVGPYGTDCRTCGSVCAGTYEAAATAAIATMEAHRDPITVSALYGYEAGLVKGFKQGIEAAAKVVEDAIPMPGSLMQTGTPAQALFIVTKLVRALSIADDGKEGAG